MSSAGLDVSVYAVKKTDNVSADHAVDVFEHAMSLRPSFADRIMARLGPADASMRHAKRFEQRVYHRLMEQQPDVIYADYGSFGVLLKDVARSLNIPLIVHFHGFDATSSFRSPEYVKQVQELMASGSQLIVPSKHLKRLLIIAGGQCQNISIIPCFPDLTKLRSIDENKARRPKLVAVGRMVGKKNPLALVEAFALVIKAIPDALLEIVGGGPELIRVKDRVRQYGLEDSVKFVGMLSHELVLKKISSAWVFVQHSVTSLTGDQEGLPVSIMEALSLGVPVVSTIHSGIPEVVEDGVNGYLVQEHDFESMAECITRLLQDSEVRSKFGMEGRRTMERFNEDGTRVEQILALLNDTVNFKHESC
jgi:glycosyltransferase involved in cell wall biosynthesis